MNSCKDQTSQPITAMDDVLQVTFDRHNTGATTSLLFGLVKRIIAFRRCALYLLNEEDQFHLQETDPIGDRGFEWVDHLIEDGIIDWLIRERKVRPIPYPKGGIPGDQGRFIVPLDHRLESTPGIYP